MAPNAQGAMAICPASAKADVTRTREDRVRRSGRALLPVIRIKIMEK